MGRTFGGFARRVAATVVGAARRLGAALAVALAGGCAGPEALEVPRQIQVTLDADTVEWATTEATLGSVRFGGRAASYLRVAYPPAASRADKTFTREHRVPLFTAAVGDTIYLQVLDESSSGLVAASAEHRFVVAARPPARPLLRWTMIDVGFGDAHLLTMPTTGRRVLIDAGERRDWPNVDAFLRASSVARLDAVLATHIHEDHIGGMVGEASSTTDGVLGRYEVGALLDSPDHSGARIAYDELLRVIASRGIPRAIVSAGETDLTNPALAWDPMVRVEALNSGNGASMGGVSEDDRINNDSIVLRLSYGDVSVVLGGDAETPVESRLLALHVPLESELLKVHHHGHIDSTDPTYLSAVNPRVGLIPIVAYESSNGTLPSPTVLERLRQRDVDVYASDRAEPLGLALAGNAGINVTVVTDGRSYEVEVEASQSRHYPGGLALVPAERPRGGGAR